MPTQTNAQIAEEAYNAVRHPSNPEWKDITNPTYRNNLLYSVDKALEGKPEDTAFGHAVLERVETQKRERAKEEGLPYTDENGKQVPAGPPQHVELKPGPPAHLPTVPNVPIVDAAGNPLPTPRPPAPDEFPVTSINAPVPTGSPEPVHVDTIKADEAKKAEERRIADEDRRVGDEQSPKDQKALEAKEAQDRKFAEDAKADTAKAAKAEQKSQQDEAGRTN